MGGAETEIGDGTTNVLLEAANFEPHAIFRTAERLRMSTEGQNRWVKGVDPYLAEPAANLATQLLLELTGATWVAHNDVHDELPQRPVITFTPEHADALIGVETPPDEQHALLQRLGFEIAGETTTVPTWRARDVTREVDVIEEIARFRLDVVPFTLPARRAMFGRLTREQQLLRRVEDVLAGLGFAETYTPSLRRDDADPDALRLPEPISADFALLRTSLLPSLVDAVRHNVDAGATGIRLFEIARVYLPQGDGELPDEHVHLGAILEGGFFDAKGAVEALCRALKVTPEFSPGSHALLHPGKTRDPAVGPARRAPSDGARGNVERVRARPRAALRRVARAGDLRGRDHVSAGPAGPRVQRGGERVRRRSRRGRARGGGRWTCARCARSTCTTASRSGKAASRSRSQSCSSRRSGRSPTRTRRSSARRSSARSPSVSAPSFAPDKSRKPISQFGSTLSPDVALRGRAARF